MMNRHALQAILGLGASLILYTSSAMAQNPNLGYPPSPEESHPTAAADLQPQRPDSAATDIPELDTTRQLTVRVRVKHATDPEATLEGVPVILHAQRPRGPFDTAPSQPVMEFTGLTDQQGVATFSTVPEGLINQGLRLQARAAFSGVSFASPALSPSNNIELPITIYDKGHDPSTISVAKLRMIVEPWEDYLVFTQFWTLINDGDMALDTSLLQGSEFERGLPLRLPTKAEGIHAMGAGRTHIVNSVVFWNGVIKPNEPVTLQIRFSVSAKKTVMEHEQTMHYPTASIEVIAPLQTTYKKVPRLNNLELLAPGFVVDTDGARLGLRTDNEYLIAHSASVEAGESFKFQLRGLPFGRPKGGWVALALALAGSVFIFGFARREAFHMRSREGAQSKIIALQQERDHLLDELAALEAAFGRHEVDEIEYEAERLFLRERTALVMKKIQDLGSQAA